MKNMKRKILFISFVFLMMTMIVPMEKVLASQKTSKYTGLDVKDDKRKNQVAALDEKENTEDQTYELKFLIDEEYGDVADVIVRCKYQEIIEEVGYIGKLEYSNIWPSIKERKTVNGTEVSVLIDDDSYYKESDKYIFLIITDKYLFPVYFNELPNKETIELVPNNEYISLPDVELKDSDSFETQYYDWNILTEEGIPTSLNEIGNFREHPTNFETIKVPYGKYNMLVNGEDEKNVYTMIKTDIELNDSINIVEFNMNELCEVDININNNTTGSPFKFNDTTTGSSFRISSFSTSSYDMVERQREVNLHGDVDKIYTTRNAGSRAYVNLETEQAWEYMYSVPKINFNKESVDINLSTKLSIESSFNLANALSGDGIMTMINYDITDIYENTVEYLSIKDKYRELDFNVEVKDSGNNIVDGVVEQFVVGQYFLYTQDLNGEYYITSRLDDSIIPIEELTQKIIIENGRIKEIEGLSNDASLKSIKLDNIEIEGFNPDIFEYNVKIASDEIPEIVAEANDSNARVYDPQIDNLIARITVGSESDISRKVYTINFEIEEKKNTPGNSGGGIFIPSIPEEIDLKQYEEKVEKKYKGFEKFKSLEKVSTEKEFTISVSKSLFNDKTEKGAVIERINKYFKLVDMDEDKKIESVISIDNDKTIKLKPKSKLKPGHVYLIVIHKEFSLNGKQLNEGATCLVTVE